MAYDSTYFEELQRRLKKQIALGADVHAEFKECAITHTDDTLVEKQCKAISAGNSYYQQALQIGRRNGGSGPMQDTESDRFVAHNRLAEISAEIRDIADTLAPQRCARVRELAEDLGLQALCIRQDLEKRPD